MFRSLIFVFVLPLFFSCVKSNLLKDFSGDAAYGHTEKIIAFGSRIPGSRGSIATTRYINEVLDKSGVASAMQEFEAQTPLGRIGMTNVIGRTGKTCGSDSAKGIVVGAHYDTKYLPHIESFIGANDAASSVGILLSLAANLVKTGIQNCVWLVFFDGEESFEEKNSDDWFYGSRYFVKTALDSGKAHLIKYMVLVDMVGDKDLMINRDLNSSPVLSDKIREIAIKLGYGGYFFGDPLYIRDDHIPFLEAGIPSVDIIDFTYGGKRSPGYYWHTAEDTIDKISPKSLKIVGDVLLNLLIELDKEI